MELIKERISPEKFKEIAGNEKMLKLAVDIDREILSIGCEFHIDCAEQLLKDGSRRKNIWGANIYPKDKTIEFTALINIRPEEGNRSMEIQDDAVRKSVEEIIHKLLF